MEKNKTIIQTLFSEFGRTILSFAVLLMGLFSYMTDRTIDNEIMQWTVWFLYALAIIQIFSISIIHSKKIIHSLWVFIQNEIVKYKHFKIIIENFDLLPEKQKEILWKLYFQKKLTLKYSSEVKNILFNKYIYKVQAVTSLEAIYALNKKITTFLANKHDKQIKNQLQNLSEDELKIIDMFYEKSSNDIYEHPWIDHNMQKAINTLSNKNIIIYNYVKSIILPHYNIKVMKQFYSNKPIKRDSIDLNLNNFAPSLANDVNDSGNERTHHSHK